MNPRSSLRFLALLALLLATASGAGAYELYSCNDVLIRWQGTTTVPVRAGQTSFPAGEWRDALTESIARWNENPSKFRFTLTVNDSDTDLQNGENEAWFTNDDSALNGAPAVAWLWWECIDFWIFGTSARMKEIDVVFDSEDDFGPDLSDKTQLLEYGGNLRPFQNVAIHELGHALGLGHEDETYNVLGQEWSHIHVNGDKARAYAGEDAANGAVKLYGLTSPRIEDVAVTHWRWDSPDEDEEYSEHRRTRLFSSSGTVLPSVGVSGERRYFVSRGQTVRPEFTYENNGASRHKTTKVGFYVSTNSTISTSDRKIGWATLDLGRNTAYTTQRAVTIPNDLNAGQDYFLGVIIDDVGQISEKTGANNATYLRIRVQ